MYLISPFTFCTDFKVFYFCRCRKNILSKTGEIERTDNVRAKRFGFTKLIDVLPCWTLVVWLLSIVKIFCNKLTIIRLLSTHTHGGPTSGKMSRALCFHNNLIDILLRLVPHQFRPKSSTLSTVGLRTHQLSSQSTVSIYHRADMNLNMAKNLLVRRNSFRFLKIENKWQCCCRVCIAGLVLFIWDWVGSVCLERK